jgi:hypothetical protein
MLATIFNHIGGKLAQQKVDKCLGIGAVFEMNGHVWLAFSLEISFRIGGYARFG